MRRELGCRPAAALAAALAALPAPACTLQVAARDGATLQVLELGPARSVDLSYRHSVTRTPVRETLTLGASGFVQQRIEFSMPGPGLPTETLPGERFERLPDRFVFDHMRRPVGVLHMRVDPDQAQTLHAAGQDHALTRWGATSLRLSIHDCD